MAIYTYEQVARVLYNAGFRGHSLAIGVAVGFAESSGNTNAHNPTPPDNSYGLFQINMLGSMGPARRAEFGLRSNEELFIASNNAKAAWSISSKGTNWRPWSTFTNGAYKKHMARAEAAAKLVISQKGEGDLPAENPLTGGTDGTTTDDDNAGYVDPTLGTSKDTSADAFFLDMPLSYQPTIQDLTILGGKVKKNVSTYVTSGKLSASMDSITQLEFNIVDINMELLKSGIFKKGNLASYMDFELVISSVETSTIGGQPGLEIKARSKVVHDLKNRKGPKVMTSTSASEFVISECKAVGAKHVVQGGIRRTQVARDVPKSEEKYNEGSQEPSTWTTFKRLAGEEGYVMFECAGVVYFGKPTWLLAVTKKRPMYVHWDFKSKYCPLEYPECISSLDGQKGAQISMSLPISRHLEARIGKATRLRGVPTFDDDYLISGFSYPLGRDKEAMTLTAETPVDPEVNQPKKPQDSNTGGPYTGGGGFGGGSNGVNPLKKMTVTAEYGRKGSWAAGYHTGVDLAATVGTPTYAVYDGKIVSAAMAGDYGNMIVLETEFGRYYYCHLSRMRVKAGDKVNAGHWLGDTGVTGRTFGPHLHFEYRVSPFAYGNGDKDPMPSLGKTVAGSTSGGAGNVGRSNSKSAVDFVAICMAQQGDQYVWGAQPSGDNPSQFDCSALVQWAANRVGIDLPRTSGQQYQYCGNKGDRYRITIERALNTRGALLFRGPSGFTHVAVSLGDGRTIEAVGKSYGVRVMNKRSNWEGQGRLIPGMIYEGQGKRINPGLIS